MKRVIKKIKDSLGDIEKLTSYLKGLNFEDPRRAALNLHLIQKGLKNLQTFNRLSQLLLEAIVESPDPDMAINNLERLSSCWDEKDRLFSFLHRHKKVVFPLITLLGSSQYLSNFLFSDPETYIKWLSTEGSLKSYLKKNEALQDLRKEVSRNDSVEEVKSILRRFRKREYLRIAIKDLLRLGTLSEITQEISNVADISLQIAYEVCEKIYTQRYGRPFYTDVGGAKKNCKFTVLGMGKLGGEELNYSSDIDIMFLYTSDKGETDSGVLTNHQFYTKIAEMITSIIGAITEEGFVFRVDTRLRPDGEKGDLASSLRSYEIYYESWGQTWERAALLKVRPVAGDEELGRSFLSMIQPFVYRKYIDFTAIEELRDMKLKIDRTIALKGKEVKDVKLGYGGIREIEFFVQALQILYGGKKPWVQERNTLRALHRLAQKGLISYEEEDILSRAYQLLRRIEHMIQIVDERQTHIMPNNLKELNTLSRRVGYRDRGNLKAYEQLLEDYSYYTSCVRRIYEGLFAREETKGEAPHKVEDWELIIGDILPEEEISRLLSRYHFKHPERAYRNIVLLRDGPPFSHQTPRSRQIFRRIFPLFFHHITDSPDPDLALNNLESLISSAGARETLYSFFEENQPAIDAIVKVFSNSEYLSKILIRHPETIDMFLDPEEILKKREKRGMEDELLSLIDQCKTYPEKLDILRKFKYSEELRIGYIDILGYVSPLDASKYLSYLADVSLTGALKIGKEEMERAYGRPLTGREGKLEEARFSIIGLGKLGGEEITYGSDLDIIFVYSGDGETAGRQTISNSEYFNRLSSKIISVLTSLTREGSVFRVDVRLRPAGSKGPLCQSIEAFQSHIKNYADLWELQILTRARFITGDRSLGKEFIEAMHKLIYERSFKADLGTYIRDMRIRMEKEVSKEDREYYDIKFGKGGIVDIEFSVQYLQLLHSARHSSIRATNTLRAMERLYKEGVLSKKRYSILRKAYIFLRTFESRVRVVHNMPSHLLPKNPERLTALAMRMGYKSRKRFLRRYETLRDEVRGVFEEVLFA